MANSCIVSYSSEEEEVIEGVDRISDLPEFILHDILYCLPMKEAARISTLSKRWNCLQSSSPDLCFYVDEYLKERGLHNVDKHLAKKRDLTSSEIVMVDEFVKMVDHHLLRFSNQNNSLSMRKFDLIMYTSHDRRWSSSIDSWIKLALENKVRILRLFLSGPLHAMNRDVFGSRQEFRSLRRLDLVGVGLSEEFIEDLIFSCPCISSLQIARCRGFKALRLSQLAYLRICFLVETPPELELIHIDAPSLKYAYVSQDLDVMFPCLYNLDSCQSLVSLDLVGSSITNNSLESFISRFRHLEVLTLDSNGSERISISSQRLKQFEVQYCEKLLEADIRAPNMSRFIYTSHNKDTFPRLCSGNARCAWEFTLYLFGRYPIHTLWFLKLREFIGKSGHSKDIKILFYTDLQVTFDLKELEGTPLPCLHEVQYLRFDLKETLPSPSDFTTLLDGLLWSCRPKTVFVEWDSSSGDEHEKLVHEKLSNRGNLRCCISNNVKCWKHFVKDVKIAMFGEVDSGRKHYDRKDPLYDFPTPSTVRKTQFTLEWC